jgi:hypothetical protein
MTNSDPDTEMLATLREGRPEATEREARLMLDLIGAMGIIRAQRGLWFNVTTRRSRDAEITEWIKATYGFDLVWPDPEPKKPRRIRRAPKATCRCESEFPADCGPECICWHHAAIPAEEQPDA